MTGIDKSAVETFVKSHYDENSKLFFDKPGDAPSILATATAFQIFNLLGASNVRYPFYALPSIWYLQQLSIKPNSVSSL